MFSPTWTDSNLIQQKKLTKKRASEEARIVNHGNQAQDSLGGQFERANGNDSKTVISEDVEIVGSIRANNAIQFDGKLSGDLACNAGVVVGTTASIKGNMTLRTVRPSLAPET